jgi:hypothetical protein
MTAPASTPEISLPAGHMKVRLLLKEGLRKILSRSRNNFSD